MESSLLINSDFLDNAFGLSDFLIYHELKVSCLDSNSEESLLCQTISLSRGLGFVEILPHILFYKGLEHH